LVGSLAAGFAAAGAAGAGFAAAFFSAAAMSCEWSSLSTSPRRSNGLDVISAAAAATRALTNPKLNTDAGKSSRSSPWNGSTEG
jgi:hypothetical protein